MQRHGREVCGTMGGGDRWYSMEEEKPLCVATYMLRRAAGARVSPALICGSLA